MDYKEIVNHITATITDLFEKNTEKFSYDKTFKAKITEIVRDGVYKIQYKGSIYKVKSFVDCTIDDYVTVCAPCNDWSELFVVKRNGFLNLRALNAQVISNTGNINQILEKSTKVKKYSFNLNLLIGENAPKIIDLDTGVGDRVLSVILERAWPITTWQNGAIVVLDSVDISKDQLSIRFASSCSQTYAIRIAVLYN